MKGLRMVICFSCDPNLQFLFPELTTAPISCQEVKEGQARASRGLGGMCVLPESVCTDKETCAFATVSFLSLYNIITTSVAALNSMYFIDPQFLGARSLGEA